MNDSERSGTQGQPMSAEAVGTLIWLLETPNLDRRRYSVVNRLRVVRESEQFNELPDALRQTVRDVLAAEG